MQTSFLNLLMADKHGRTLAKDCPKISWRVVSLQMIVGSIYVPAMVYITVNQTTAPFWKKEIFPDEHSNIAPGKSGIFAYDYHQGQFIQKINGTGEWSPIYTNFQLKGIIAPFLKLPEALFSSFATRRGLFKSTNSGKTWKQVHTGGW